MENEYKILMYHSIGSERFSYCISIDNFKKQIQMVAPTKDVVITFDDGTVTQFTNAFPILEKSGIKAYFFIIVNNIERTGYMNWKQIAQIDKAGMIIGSHCMSHKILTKLSDEELNNELANSKNILEERLKKKVDFLSIPKGYYDKRVTETAKKIGYTRMFTSDLSKNNDFISGRIAVRANWNENYFRRIITGDIPFKEKFTFKLKKIAKNILGNCVYDGCREALIKKNK